MALLLHWSERDRLHAVGTGDQLLRSTDGGATWAETGGRVPDAPAAFTVHGEQYFVATRDGRVLRSDDAGATWQPLETSLSQLRRPLVLVSPLGRGHPGDQVRRRGTTAVTASTEATGTTMRPHVPAALVRAGSGVR